MTDRNEAGVGPDGNPDGPLTIKTDHETSHSMSEPTTPSKGPTKRRGLALPPRGQALARLQDLERDSEEVGASNPAGTGDRDKEPPFTEGSNAVNTASSNAVYHQDSTAGVTDDPWRQDVPPPALAAPAAPPRDAPQSLPAAVPSGARQSPPVRAAREPTTRITVDMPDSLHRKISLLSVETRRTIKDLVLEALAATYFGAEADGQ